MPLLNGFGAGAVGAGVAPAGHDVPEDPGERVLRAPNAANHFDPELRVWVQNGDGSLVAASPVIQRAAILMLPAGGIASTPEDGMQLEGIRRSNPATRLAAIRADLEQAWAPLIAAGELTIVSIDVDASVPWNGRWTVTVTDNTTGQQAKLP